MKLTKALKSWLSKNCGVAEGASDDEFRKAAGAAVMAGTLDTKTLADLQKDEVQTENKTVGDRILEKLDSIDGRVSALEKKPASEGTEGKKTTETQPATPSNDDIVSKTVESTIKALMPALTGRDQMRGAAASFNVDDDGPTPAKLFTQTTEGTETARDARVRVKSAVESYSTTCSKAVYNDNYKYEHLRGKTAHTGDFGHELSHPSQLQKAICGAWFKFAVSSDCAAKGKAVPRPYRMTEHDNALVQYAIHEVPFVGGINQGEDGIPRYGMRGDRKLFDMERKALLDDSTSGGLEAAPIYFDDALILTPILSGEIFPLVKVVNLTRGRRVEGFSMGNPTITSGTAEGTSIAIFDTASFIAAFDTTIYNAVGAMEIGKDFEEDSPTNIGEQVMTQYGQQFLAWLDEQVVVGDGTTEPQGIFNASGTTAVTCDNTTTGPPTLGDYEGLLFGVKKKYKQTPEDRNSAIFVSNETTYKRSRGMKVDPQSSGRDERRLFGLDHENYITLGRPHKINEQITNSKIGYFIANRYRMYRRLGMQISVEEGGKELTLTNKRLIVLRARFGGQLEDGGACSVATAAQS